MLTVTFVSERADPDDVEFCTELQRQLEEMLGRAIWLNVRRRPNTPRPVAVIDGGALLR